MPYFDFQKLLKDTKKVATISICALLLIINIVAFAMMSTSIVLPSFLTIIISNLISIILTFFIYKPINDVIEEEANKRLENKNDIEKILNEQNQELKSQNQQLEKENNDKSVEINTLKSELDSARQYKSLRTITTPVLKLETLEYEKEGYIVKEDYVRDLEIGKNIPKDGIWKFDDKGEQKVLYIKKFHEKAIIGFDIEKVRLCRHDGKVYIEGIKMENLHPELKPVNNDYNENVIEHCLIINQEDNGKISINQSDKYDDFKEQFNKNQNDIFDNDFKAEITNICSKYTSIMRQNLNQIFPNIEFIDNTIEDRLELENEKIYSITQHFEDNDIMEISSEIATLANTINKTAAITYKKY